MKDYLLQVNPLFEQFVDEMNLTIALFDLRGNCITHRNGGKEFCCIVKAQLGGDCQKEDEKALNNARRSGKPCRYKCHAGLTEIVFPLLDADGTVVGFIIIGKFREEECLEEARAAAQNTIKRGALKRDKTLAAFEDLPTLSENEIRKALALLSEIAQTLRETDCLKILTSPYVRQTFDMIETIKTSKDDCAKKLTGKQLYQDFHMSRNALDARFMDACGKSPACFLSDRRMVGAEDLLRNTNDSIEKIAEKLGYEPLSFTAFFKRRCGIAPAKFRKSRQNRPAAGTDPHARRNPKRKDDTTLPF